MAIHDSIWSTRSLILKALAENPDKKCLQKTTAQRNLGSAWAFHPDKVDIVIKSLRYERT
jgi:hypothetical protein